jgi:hypothetical protein
MAMKRSIPCSRRWRALGVLAPWILACTGDIGQPSGAEPRPDEPAPSTRTPGSPGGVTTAAPGTPGASVPSGAAAAAAGSSAPRARRLGHVEYENTLKDLLGVASTPAAEFPEDARAGQFIEASRAAVTPLLASSYSAAAASISHQVVTANLAALAPCPGTDQGACATSFIRTFGRRAFRRPLTDAQVAAFRKLYDEERGRTDHAGGIRVLVAAFLQSPHFLYRLELGEGAGPGPRKLSSHEVASALSYLLWESMPDEALSSAADRGELATPAQIEGQARRLLASPRARSAVRRFFLEWLDLAGLSAVEKDTTFAKWWTAAIKEAMVREVGLLVDEVVWKGGSFETLFSAPFTFSTHQDLGPFYDVGQRGGSADRPVRLELPPDRRAGLLTLGAFLARHSHMDESFPIGRGVFVLEELMCRTPGRPPANVPPPPAASERPQSTTRDRFAEHSSDPVCAGCHQIIDPIGFLFEHYDPVGRFRTSEMGKPIVAAGTVRGLGDLDGEHRSAVDFSKRLARSQDFKRCVAQQLFRFTMARPPAPDEGTVLDRLAAPLVAPAADLREALVGLVLSGSFLTRTPVP